MLFVKEFLEKVNFEKSLQLKRKMVRIFLLIINIQIIDHNFNTSNCRAQARGDLGKVGSLIWLTSLYFQLREVLMHRIR